jgi:hypothetical protein
MMIEQMFLDSAVKRFREYKELAEKAFAQLDEQQMLWQPDENSNSIAMIIQHMHGNMVSRWTNFLTEDGEKPSRDRDAEFEPQNLTKTELLKRWEEGWRTMFRTLEALQPEDLLKTITIRSQPLVVVDAINRQLAHYCGHVGQILYIGKWQKGPEWNSLSIPKGKLRS